MCHRKLTVGKKKKRFFFNQNHNFLINSRVSWNLLTTSNPGACCSFSGPSSAEIYMSVLLNLLSLPLPQKQDSPSVCSRRCRLSLRCLCSAVNYDSL